MFKIFFMFFSNLLYSSADIFWYDTKQEKFVDEKFVKKLILESNIVYVGEIHDRKRSHDLQLKILKLIYKKKRNIVVGFEMLNKTFQKVLDDFTSGRITELEFLQNTNWKKEWGFDFELYKPIFSYVRKKNIKAFALNAPSSIVSKVAKSGFNILSDNEKKVLASEINIPEDKNYLEYLKDTYFHHLSTSTVPSITLDNYIYAMSVWNETMGEVIANFMKENPNYIFLVIAGNGHVMNAAIPFSVKRRTKDFKHLSIYVEDISSIDNVSKIKNTSDIICFLKLYDKK